MPFLKSMPANAGPPAVYSKYPEIYRPWSEMSEAMMNGPSSLSRGERELVLAYAAGVAGCDFVYVAHAEVAYALGIEEGSMEALLADPQSSQFDARLLPLMAFVRKLTLNPGEMSQADVDAVLDAGFDEKALDDAIGITARAAFMHRLVQAYGFIPMQREEAVRRANKRIEHGYVNLYPAFKANA